MAFDVLSSAGEILTTRFEYLLLANMIFISALLVYTHHKTHKQGKPKFDWTSMLPKRVKNRDKRMRIWLEVTLPAILALIVAYVSSTPTVSIFKMLVLYYFGVCFLVPFVWTLKNRPKPEFLGFSWRHWHDTTIETDLIIGLVLAELLALTVIFSGINMSLTFIVQEQRTIFASILFAIFINSLLEEVFWRSYVLGNLERLTTPAHALFIHSVLFTGYHVGWSFFRSFDILINIFFASLLFGFVYQRTRSILGPWILHAIINIISVIFILGIHVGLAV